MRDDPMPALVCRLGLPDDFRRDDLLAFHRRDAAMLAEQVEGGTLRKGVVWNGRPACLTLRFGARDVCGSLAIDGRAPARDDAALEKLVRRMLGLTQAIEAFEQRFRTHPVVGPLIVANAGLRVPQSASPFEALSWAVTGQQISLAAALSLRRRLIQAAGLRHSSGIWCYPDSQRLAGMREAALREAGFSQGKARCVLDLSRAVADKSLPLDDWVDAPPVDEIRTRLLQLRGIGPWTVDYTLLRGFSHLDGSLHGDAAVRRRLQALLGSPSPVSAPFVQGWLAPFAPWRALLAAHLWAMPDAPATA